MSSNYFCLDVFYDVVRSHEHSLKIVHINAQSLSNKFDELEHFVSEAKFLDVLCISETWWRNGHCLNLNNYSVFATGRDNKRGGGIALYAHDSLNVVTNDTFTVVSDHYECLTIELNNFLISCFYRPPNSNIDCFFDFFISLTDFAHLYKKDIIILGDFNINMLTQDSFSLRFSDIISCSSLHSVISLPTRITDTSSTLLDLCLTNCNSSLAGIIQWAISDHLPIFSFFKIFKNKNQFNHTQVFLTRRLNQSNLINFVSLLAETDWSNILSKNCPNASYNLFMATVKDTYETCFPLLPVQTRKKFKNPWMTNHLLRKIRLKNRLFRKFLVTKIASDLQTFKQFRNKLNNDIKTAKQLYFRNLFNGTSPKKSWFQINKLMGRGQSHNNLNSLTVNDITITDPFHIATALNNYFVNVPYQLSIQNNSNTHDYSSFINHSNSNSIYLSPITRDELLKQLLSLNISKGPGHDDIHPKAIKFAAQFLITPLCHIFNKMFETGIIPESLKISKVYPIYKKGKRTDISNYRPISVLSVFSKVFERLFFNRLYDFLNNFNILHKSQFGFVKNKSCEIALLHIQKLIQTNLESGLITVGVFFDLSKAFDTINHEILFSKLYAMGIRGPANDIIKNYLSNRKQFVSLSGVKSNIQITNCGVPQGSILGPLLFICYMNDIFNLTSPGSVFLYADDTSLFFANKNFNVLQNTVNNEIDRFLLWFRINFLTLNSNKTKCVIFHNKLTFPHNFKLQINDHIISPCSDIKFLGVTLQSDLKWNIHVDSICKKLSSTVGALGTISHFLPAKVLTTLYYTLIYPHLIYGLLVWGQTTATNFKRLATIQSKFLRLHSASSTHLQANINILHPAKLYNYRLACFMFERIKLNRHHDLISLNYRNSRYPFRDNNQLIPPYCRTNRALAAIDSTTIRLWNSLPQSLKSQNNLQKFKKIIKLWLTEQ